MNSLQLELRQDLAIPHGMLLDPNNDDGVTGVVEIKGDSSC